MKNLYIVVAADFFFLSHRKAIGIAAKNQGYNITVIAKDTGKKAEIEALGFNFVDLPINRTGINLREELTTFRFLYLYLKNNKPDIIHLVGPKPILWGGLAAKILRIPGMVSAISGLGMLFSEGYRKSFITNIVLLTLRFIHHRKNVFCIFQNNEDLNFYVTNKIIDKKHCVKTNGSGINLKEYTYEKEPISNIISILFTGRMVEDKGVLVLINAANLLRNEYYNKIEFLLCGGIYPNPHSISKEQLESQCDGTYIKWLGHRDDVHALLKQSHIFVFPSFYKEGLPKSCIEAAAVGRPIITSDSIGCRDTIIDGETGFLVPIKNSQAIADKLKILIDHPDIRKRMGEKARIYAEKNFAIEDVVNTHLSIYNRLTDKEDFNS